MEKNIAGHPAHICHRKRWSVLLHSTVLPAVISSLFMMALYSCKNKQTIAADTGIYYTCSMDPQVMEHKPGKCPICHMELTPVKKSKTENADELLLSEQQIQLGNITTDTLQSGSMGDQLVLTATLNFDEAKTTSVSSRVSGRIEKLYFKNMGDHIRKGDALYDLYSEELNNAKQEYLLAIERRQVFTGETAIDFEQLLQSARYKLRLWGMSDAQVKQLELAKKANPLTTFYSTEAGNITSLDAREGDYVMEGGPVVKLADLSSLWAEAQVYTSQLSAIDLDGTAVVQLPDLEGKEIRGRIAFANPEINPDTRINLVRIAIPNTGYLLKPGMPAYVVMKSRQHQSLSLPIDAVIRDGKGAAVWVRTGEKSFKTKMVRTGLETGERIEIVSGLAAGEVVVISGAYLLQSEYIFKRGANPMDGMKM